MSQPTWKSAAIAAAAASQAAAAEKRAADLKAIGEEVVQTVTTKLTEMTGCKDVDGAWEISQDVVDTDFPVRVTADDSVFCYGSALTRVPVLHLLVPCPSCGEAKVWVAVTTAENLGHFLIKGVNADTRCRDCVRAAAAKVETPADALSRLIYDIAAEAATDAAIEVVRNR